MLKVKLTGIMPEHGAIELCKSDIKTTVIENEVAVCIHLHWV
jgi:hypothetical protein